MPRASRDRQIWINGTQKYCEHKSTEEVHNQAGEILAVVCRGCGVRIAEVGDCDGLCGRKRVALTSFLVTGKRPRRFHNEDCRQQTIQREKEARAARPTTVGGSRR